MSYTIYFRTLFQAEIQEQPLSSRKTISLCQYIFQVLYLIHVRYRTVAHHGHVLFANSIILYSGKNPILSDIPIRGIIYNTIQHHFQL